MVKKKYAIKQDPKFLKYDANKYDINIIPQAKPSNQKLNCPEDNENCGNKNLCYRNMDGNSYNDIADKSDCNKKDHCKWCDSTHSGKMVCYQIMDSNNMPLKLSNGKIVYICESGDGACVPTYGTQKIPDLRHPYENPKDAAYKANNTTKHYEGNTHHHIIDHPLKCGNTSIDFTGDYESDRNLYNSQYSSKEGAKSEFCRTKCPKDSTGKWVFPNLCSDCD